MAHYEIDGAGQATGILVQQGANTLRGKRVA